MFAFDEMYLDDAMKNLGEAFDYAVNACSLSPDAFAKLFIATGFANAFEKGNPKYISGKSGTELVMEVFERTGKSIVFPKAQIEYDFSPEYWAGWILAYSQWKTGKSYREILGLLSMEDILKLYPTLHEASEDRFVDTVYHVYQLKENPTRLQKQRIIYRCSQKELALASGVNLRTLQQYELGAKRLEKASVSSVLALANVLGCKVEDIL